MLLCKPGSIFKVVIDLDYDFKGFTAKIVELNNEFRILTLTLDDGSIEIFNFDNILQIGITEIKEELKDGK